MKSYGLQFLGDPPSYLFYPQKVLEAARPLPIFLQLIHIGNRVLCPPVAFEFEDGCHGVWDPFPGMIGSENYRFPIAGEGFSGGSESCCTLFFHG